LKSQDLNQPALNNIFLFLLLFYIQLEFEELFLLFPDERKEIEAR